MDKIHQPFNARPAAGDLESLVASMTHSRVRRTLISQEREKKEKLDLLEREKKEKLDRERARLDRERERIRKFNLGLTQLDSLKTGSTSLACLNFNDSQSSYTVDCFRRQLYAYADIILNRLNEKAYTGAEIPHLNLFFLGSGDGLAEMCFSHLLESLGIEVQLNLIDPVYGRTHPPFPQGVGIYTSLSSAIGDNYTHPNNLFIGLNAHYGMDRQSTLEDCDRDIAHLNSLKSFVNRSESYHGIPNLQLTSQRCNKGLDDATPFTSAIDEVISRIEIDKDLIRRLGGRIDWKLYDNAHRDVFMSGNVFPTRDQIVKVMLKL